MFTAIYILNFKGEILYSNIFDENSNNFAFENFRINIIDVRSLVSHSPINKIDKYFFVHMTISNGLYLMGILTNNSNVALCLEYFRAVKNILFEICGIINENEISKRRFKIFEILDCTVQNGIPQITDLNGLKNLIIKPIKNKKELSKNVHALSQITGQVSWRDPNIKYTYQSLYLTVMEYVNMKVSSSGEVLSSSVDGSIAMKSNMTGMPECVCGLNDKMRFMTAKIQSRSSME